MSFDSRNVPKRRYCLLAGEIGQGNLTIIRAAY